MEALHVIIGSVVGTLVSSLLGCLPALHVFNVAGFAVMGVIGLEHAGVTLPEAVITSFMIGLVTGYAMVNTIPSIFLGTPDESAMFITLPGQKYLMQGRGYEATMLTAVGGLGGVAALALLSPFLPSVVGPLKQLVGPHMHWILGIMIAFMVLGEWPKGGDRGTPLHRFIDGWKSLAAGFATLILSGFLGFIILYRPLVPIEASFQNIMPAFVGLYAVPWLITNVMTRNEIPKQHVARSIDLTASLAARGVAAGTGGGLFAAFFPIITGGMGGLLAGHATAQRDDRLFVVSQGTSKVVYYVGAFLLMFVPGTALTRGGLAWMVSGIVRPYSFSDYYGAVAAVCISGALAFFMLSLLARGTLKVVTTVNFRWLSVVTAAIVFGVVYVITGWQGLACMFVGTGIGLIPVLFHSRRMNCMGVLLIPVMLNMAGVGPTVARWMGLAE